MNYDPAISPNPKKTKAINPFEVFAGEPSTSSFLVASSSRIRAGNKRVAQNEIDKPVQRIYASIYIILLSATYARAPVTSYITVLCTIGPLLSGTII